MFVETSAFASTNVNTAFETLLNAISDVRSKMSNNGYMNNKKCLRLNDPELED